MHTRPSARERLYELLVVAAPGDFLSRLLNRLLALLILLNALALGLKIHPFFAPYHLYFTWFSWGCAGLFSVEYLLRLWTATCSPASRSPLGGRLHLLVRPVMLADLAALAALGLPMLVRPELVLLRLWRLERVLFLVRRTRTQGQRPAAEPALEELLDQAQEGLAAICKKVAAARDQDLERVRRDIGAAVEQIRRLLQGWFGQSRGALHQEEEAWKETRRQLLELMGRLETGLAESEGLHQIDELVRSAGEQSSALFDQVPEWASRRVALEWKGLESYRRVPVRRIGQAHFRELRSGGEGLMVRFNRVYLGGLHQKMDNLRSAMNYALGLTEKDPAGELRAATFPQEAQTALNRATNRLSDLGDPAHSAWDGLLWELEDAQRQRLAVTRTDLARYGSAAFHLGCLGRWGRRRALALFLYLRGAGEQLVPVLRQQYDQAYESVYERLRPLRQWLGLVRPPTLEVIQILDEARLEVVDERGMSADYRRHFAFTPLEDESLFVGFAEEMTLIGQAVQRWEEQRPASFIIHGQRGGGKTTLLNIAGQRFLAQGQLVTRATITQKMTTVRELTTYLSGLLELSAAQSAEEFAQALLAGPRRVVLLEGCHHLYLRHVGGLDAFRHLCWLVAHTNHHVLWGIGLDKYAHNYLSKSLPLGRLFHFSVTIEEWGQEELRRLILLRHHMSGYRLRYIFDQSLEKPLRRRIKHWRRPDEPMVQEALAQIYFERLAAACGENILVALYYWLRSLQPADEDSYQVLPMKELNLGLINRFSLDQAFILAAVLQHDSLSAAELAKILDTALMQTQLEVEILENQNILESDPQTGRFRVNPVALKPVARMLEERNLIY